MDYKQKYNEALARAKVHFKANQKIDESEENDILSDIFPELEESEGEEIRKQIISFLKEFEYDHYRSLDFSSWIAWLEKQGKQSSNILWHDVSEEPEEQREIFCEWRGSDTVWHDVVFYHANTKTFRGVKRWIIDNVVKWTYVDEMLEKQDETFTKRDVDDAYLKGISDCKHEIDKQKTTWKPTEEQIEALEHLLETIRRHEYSYFHEEKFLLLHSLLEQLKKL